LNAGDDAAEILTEITKRFENITIDAEENGSEEVVTISNEAVSTEDALKGIAVSESVPETQSTVTFDAEQYAILADEADEEIVEIFIEEAIEVLGELHTYYPQWKSDTDDDEAMAVVRRSFHTLKGSGRLLGADLIGEFSWKFENMLNRIIDKKINVSDKVFLALDEALAVLPQLIEQLKGNREPIDNIAQLMEFTDAVAEGKDVSYQTESIGAGEVKETSDLNNESVSAVEEDIVEEESLSEVTDIDLQPADQEVEQVEPEIEFIDVSDSTQSIEIDEEISISDTMDTLEVVESDISFDAPDVEEDTNDTDIVKIDIEESSSNDELISFDDVTSDVDDLEDTIDLSAIDDVADDLESIKQQLDESESIGKPLRADTSLIRAFHTLYGSARTAEVEAIADLSGAAEKYIKTRQEGNDNEIPGEVFSVLREIEEAVTVMLAQVENGNLPTTSKDLLEKINKIVQQEIQAQLQMSWQDNSPVEADVTEKDDSVSDEISKEIKFDLSELSPDIDASNEIDSVEQSEATLEETTQVSYGDIDDELINIFLEEAEELLESCEDTLNEIKSAPNSLEPIHQLQRNMHTLKGGARMADLRPIGDLTHNLESLVVMIEDNKVDTDKRLFDLLHESLDELTSLLEKVKTRQPLSAATDLNNSIEMLMRGEVAEKRSIERFDVDLSELAKSSDEDEEGLEVLSVSDEIIADGPVVNEAEAKVAENTRNSDKAEERPHWGERVSDVNFKDSQEQVRVRSDLLNNLVNYAGEVNIYHARMGKQVSDFSFNLSELTQTVVRLKDQLRNLEIETEIQIRSGYEKESDDFDDNFDPLEMDQYSTMQQLTRSLSETAGDVESINEILAEIMRDSETLLLQESRVSTDLQEEDT